MMRYTLILMFILVGAVTQAQIKVGIQTGIGNSWLHTSYISSFRQAGSYTFGVMSFVPLKNNFSIVSGLKYQILKAQRSQLSFKRDGQLTYGSYPIFTETSFLTVPLSGRYNIKIKQKPSFYVEGGGYLSYLMSFKNSGKTSYKYPPEDIEFHEDLNKYNRLTVGVSSAIGLFIKSHVELAIKYDYPLTSLTNENVNFRNVQLLVGYNF